MTVVLVIASGVLVYVLGRTIFKFSIEPLYRLRKVIEEISHALIFYANVYTNPSATVTPKEKEASEKFRNLASSLQTIANSIPFYNFFEKLRLTPNSSSIKNASKELIGLSNSTGLINSGVVNAQIANKIRKLLNIRT